MCVCIYFVLKVRLFRLRQWLKDQLCWLRAMLLGLDYYVQASVSFISIADYSPAMAHSSVCRPIRFVISPVPPLSRSNEPFQTFVGGIVAFRALPRPQFSTLQASVFPVYFGLQTVLPLVVAATYPGEKTPYGAAASGIVGLLSDEKHINTLPLLTVFVSGLLNLMIVGPATSRKMNQRKQQG